MVDLRRGRGGAEVASSDLVPGPSQVRPCVVEGDALNAHPARAHPGERGWLVRRELANRPGRPGANRSRGPGRCWWGAGTRRARLGGRRRAPRGSRSRPTRGPPGAPAGVVRLYASVLLSSVPKVEASKRSRTVSRPVSPIFLHGEASRNRDNSG